MDELSHWVKCLNDFFNPTTTQHFLECNSIVSSSLILLRTKNELPKPRARFWRMRFSNRRRDDVLIHYSLWSLLRDIIKMRVL